jgi:hypothetical protein
MKDALIFLRIIRRQTRNKDYLNKAVIEGARKTLRRAKSSVGICQIIEYMVVDHRTEEFEVWIQWKSKVQIVVRKYHRDTLFSLTRSKTEYQ